VDSNVSCTTSFAHPLQTSSFACTLIFIVMTSELAVHLSYLRYIKWNVVEAYSLTTDCVFPKYPTYHNIHFSMHQLCTIILQPVIAHLCIIILQLATHKMNKLCYRLPLENCSKTRLYSDGCHNYL